VSEVPPVHVPPVDIPEVHVQVEERPPRWGLGDAVLGCLVGWLLAGLIVIVFVGPMRTPNLSLVVIALSEVGLWAGLLGAPVIATWRKGRRSLVRDFGLTARWRDAPIGVAAGLVASLVVVPVIYVPLFRLIGHRDLGAPARELTDKAHGPGFVILATVVVIGAPIVEELFFRGLVLRSLLRRWGATASVIGSALLFGVVHLELLQLPALVMLGLVLGVLAVRTGRLGPSIWAHGAFNAVTVVSLALHR
jgi:membrane protease YdiL (CAAX protease family)